MPTSDWTTVQGITSQIFQIGGSEYNDGNATYKCLYDDTHFSFAFAVPGDYRFNSTASELCAKIAVILKIGSNATFVNMGGLPQRFIRLRQIIPSTCDDYRVDIGAEWHCPGQNNG